MTESGEPGAGSVKGVEQEVIAFDPKEVDSIITRAGWGSELYNSGLTEKITRHKFSKDPTNFIDRGNPVKDPENREPGDTSEDDLKALVDAVGPGVSMGLVRPDVAGRLFGMLGDTRPDLVIGALPELRFPDADAVKEFAKGLVERANRPNTEGSLVDRFVAEKIQNSSVVGKIPPPAASPTPPGPAK